MAESDRLAGSRLRHFDVVADPRERANLKERRRDVYDRMEANLYAWHATMLPEITDRFGKVFVAAGLADHIGAR